MKTLKISRTAFTTREIKPTGWLRKQLRLQADGLSGHLDQIWPDIQDSRWFGGERDGWERVPYWLDGFIPLAWMLDDADLKERAKRYVDMILDRQQEDGWICPCEDDQRGIYDLWAAILIAKVLTVYVDCTGDQRAEIAVYRVMKNVAEHLKRTLLFNWGAARSFEAMIPLNWLMDKKAEPWMEELAITIKSQGTDYVYLFDHWKDQIPHGEWRYQTHVVNLSMALKYAAVYYRIEGNDGNTKAKKMIRLLERYHGMAIGHFTGDECLSGTSALRGTELCGVVEGMYAYEVLFRITGDAFWLQKLEKLAYNALPATISKDMWTHQYVQMSNQTTCRSFDRSPVFRTVGPEANMFGLEPNFGCCTANFNQGWPKLALATFVKEGDDTIVSCLTLPSELRTTVSGVEIAVSLITDYPFRESLVYKVSVANPVRFTLKVHVPENCKTVWVNGDRALVQAGFVAVSTDFHDETVIDVRFEFETVMKKRPKGLYSIERGPLVYALPVASKWTSVEYERNGVERKYPYCDYTVTPVSNWNYAFTGEQFHVKEKDIPRDFPFSEQNPPVVLETNLVPIHWGCFQDYEDLCAEYPEDTTPIGVPEKISMIPYGCTTLRMTEMPLAGTGRKNKQAGGVRL